MFLDKIKQIEDRFTEMERDMLAPDIISDPVRYSSLMKEYKALEPVAGKIRLYFSYVKEMEDARDILSDPRTDKELRELAENEARELSQQCDALEDEIKLLIIPRDPNDSRNVVVEIRACAGGEEAALFASDLYRMYTMYASANGFRVEPVNSNPTELGGYKEMVFTVSGDGAFSKFKFESGVHRVQRIPVTESNGKIQTSTVSVAVLPEAEAVEVSIDPSDIRFETCKSSGAGGQHINKTESAVRLIHKPSGIVIECDQERSQFQNKDKALRLLYSKLYDLKSRASQDAEAAERKSQVGSGDRSEKIRTYNYPQSRITDHRIGKTVYNFDAFLNGDIGNLITELAAHEAAERLKESES